MKNREHPRFASLNKAADRICLPTDFQTATSGIIANLLPIVVYHVVSSRRPIPFQFLARAMNKYSGLDRKIPRAEALIFQVLKSPNDRLAHTIYVTFFSNSQRFQFDHLFSHLDGLILTILKTNRQLDLVRHIIRPEINGSFLGI
jgi:ABC-type amino acid transport substrate-binding protein